MITVKVGQHVKCMTVGHSSSGHTGILERICDTEEDRKFGLGIDFGIVDGVSCNLHHCILWPVEDFWSMPVLNLEMLQDYRGGNKHPIREVYELLDKEEYTNLGYANSGIRIPKDFFLEVYADTSGNVIMVNHSKKIYYSIDMGD